MPTTDGRLVPLDESRLEALVEEACAGLDGVASAPFLAEARRNLYDGISQEELGPSRLSLPRGR